MECPQCKEPIVIGNVCPVCGYIIEDEVSGLSPRTLTDSIEQNLNFMKAVPDISLWSVFSNWMTWVMPFIAIGFAVMALKSEAGIFWLLFIITAIVSIWKIIASMKKMKTGPHSDFNVLKNDMETLLRLLRRDYGASGQVRRLADDVEAQVFSIVNGRDAALRRNRLISAIIVVLVSALMILAIVGIFAIVI